MSAPHRAANAPAARLERAAGILALCVLADSALERYRGSFHNRAMVVPLITSALEIGASAQRLTARRSSGSAPRDGLAALRARRAVHALAIATGLVGTGFHVFNIGKREGGFSFLNLFYGAPVAAPAALVLSGLLGLAAEAAAEGDPKRLVRHGSRRGACEPRSQRGLASGRLIALLASLGIIGTVGEAALLHFRGAYHNKAMYLPITLPPLAAAVLGASAASPRAGAGLRRAARRLLRAMGALGFAGTAFHAYGVSRGMGGWRNWTQNLLDGPPLPAPPSFAALSVAGLAALDMQGRGMPRAQR